MNDTADRMYKDGHLISNKWHTCFISNTYICSYEIIWIWKDLISEIEWNDLTKEDSGLNVLWKKQMDNVAGYLKQLANKNIQVLWRPFHKKNGIWFWSCNHPGEKSVIFGNTCMIISLIHGIK